MWRLTQISGRSITTVECHTSSGVYDALPAKSSGLPRCPFCCTATYNYVRGLSHVAVNGVARSTSPFERVVWYLAWEMRGVGAEMMFPWEQKPELQKDASGLYPGERETGLPNFLRRTAARSSAACASPAANLRRSDLDWLPPWGSTSPFHSA